MKRKILSALMICFVSVMISCGLFFVGGDSIENNVVEDEVAITTATIPDDVEGMWYADDFVVDRDLHPKIDGGELVVEIALPHDLARFSVLVNANAEYNGYYYKSARVELLTSIDLSKHFWLPIGTYENPFSGTFNGNGHTIKGLYIDTDSMLTSQITTRTNEYYCYDKNDYKNVYNCKYFNKFTQDCWLNDHIPYNLNDFSVYHNAGLFGVIDGADISNFSISSGVINIETPDELRAPDNTRLSEACITLSVGAVVGSSAPSEAYITPPVGGVVGGIFGGVGPITSELSSLSSVQCNVDISVDYDKILENFNVDIGGLAGSISSISDASYSGSIYYNSNFSGDESDTYTVGGLAGRIVYKSGLEGFIILDSANYANITCDSKAICGGIVGAGSGVIWQCANLGDIYYVRNATSSSDIDNVGGIVGHMSATAITEVDECVNYGDIYGPSSGSPQTMVYSSAEDFNSTMKGMGGIVGFCDGATSGGTIDPSYVRQCINYGNLCSKIFDMGGIIGLRALNNISVRYSGNYVIKGVTFDQSITYQLDLKTLHIYNNMNMGLIHGGEKPNRKAIYNHGDLGSYMNRWYLYNYGQIVSNYGYYSSASGADVVNKVLKNYTLFKGGNFGGSQIKNNNMALTGSINSENGKVEIDQSTPSSGMQKAVWEMHAQEFFDTEDNWYGNFANNWSDYFLVTPMVYDYYKNIDPERQMTGYFRGYSIVPRGILRELNIGNAGYRVLESYRPVPTAPPVTHYVIKEIPADECADYIKYYSRQYVDDAYNGWAPIEWGQADKRVKYVEADSVAYLKGLEVSPSGENPLIKAELTKVGFVYFSFLGVQTGYYYSGNIQGTQGEIYAEKNYAYLGYNAPLTDDTIQVYFEKREGYNLLEDIDEIVYMDPNGNILTSAEAKSVVGVYIQEGEIKYGAENTYTNTETGETWKSKNFVIKVCPEVGYKIGTISEDRTQRIGKLSYMPSYKLWENEDDTLGDMYIELDAESIFNVYYYGPSSTEKWTEKPERNTKRLYIWMEYVEYTWELYDDNRNFGGELESTGTFTLADFGVNGDETLNIRWGGNNNALAIWRSSLEIIEPGESERNNYWFRNDELGIDCMQVYRVNMTWFDWEKANDSYYSAFWGGESELHNCWDANAVFEFKIPKDYLFAEEGWQRPEGNYANYKINTNTETKIEFRISRYTDDYEFDLVSSANSYFDRETYNRYSDGYGGYFLGFGREQIDEYTGRRIDVPRTQIEGGGCSLNSGNGEADNYFKVVPNENFEYVNTYDEETGHHLFDNLTFEVDLSQLSDSAVNKIAVEYFNNTGEVITREQVIENLYEKIEKLGLFKLAYDEDEFRLFLMEDSIGNNHHRIYFRSFWRDYVDQLIHHNKDLNHDHKKRDEEHSKIIEEYGLTIAEMDALITLRNFDFVAKFTLDEFYLAGDILYTSGNMYNGWGNSTKNYFLSDGNRIGHKLTDSVSILMPRSKGGVEQNINFFTNTTNNCYNANKAYYQAPYVLTAKDYRDDPNLKGYEFIGYYIRQTKKVEGKTYITYQVLSYEKTFIFENGSFLNGVETKGVSELRNIYTGNKWGSYLEGAETLVLVAVYGGYDYQEEVPECEEVNGQKLYKISSENHLRWMSNQSVAGNTFEGVIFKQMCDINFDYKSTLLPIGSIGTPFKGVYDGNGYVISGLYFGNNVELPGFYDILELEGGQYDPPHNNVVTNFQIPRRYAGLFGFTDGAIIKNLTMDNIVIIGLEHCGAVVGCAKNTTFECVSVYSYAMTSPTYAAWTTVENFSKGENDYSGICKGTALANIEEISFHIFDPDDVYQAAILIVSTAEEIKIYFDHDNDSKTSEVPYVYASYDAEKKSYVNTSFSTRNLVSNNGLNQLKWYYTIAAVAGYATNCNFYKVCAGDGGHYTSNDSFEVLNYVSNTSSARGLVGAVKDCYFEECYLDVSNYKNYGTLMASPIEFTYFDNGSEESNSVKFARNWIVNCYLRSDTDNYFGADPASDPDVWMKLNGKWVLKCYYWC